MSINAYIYTRYSSHNQDDGNSIKAQEDGIREFVKNYREKIEIIGEYSDKAISGMTDKRPEYQKMLDDIKNNDEVTCIIVHRLDRLHRNARNQLNDIYELQGMKKKILTADGIDTSNPDHMARILDVTSEAEKYALRLIDETRKGLKANATDCVHNGGTVPYGFQLDCEKHLMINPITSPAVKKMFEMKAAGLPYKEIINWLDENNYKTVNNKSFPVSTIIAILKNEKYMGVYTWDKSAAKDFRRKRNSHKKKENYIRNEGGCPAIVSAELFEKVQESFKEKRQKSKYNYLVKDRIFCAECGKKIGIHTEYKKTGETVPKYRNNCDCLSTRTINQEYLDDMVMYALRECIFSSVNYRLLEERLDAYSASLTDSTECEVRELEAYKAECDKRRVNLVDVIARGYGSTTVAEEILKLENNIKNTEKRISELLSTKHCFTDEEIKNIRSEFVTYLLEERNEDTINAVDDTIERIDVGDDIITVTFKSGISVSNTTRKNFN